MHFWFVLVLLRKRTNTRKERNPTRQSEDALKELINCQYDMSDLVWLSFFAFVCVCSLAGNSFSRSPHAGHTRTRIPIPVSPFNHNALLPCPTTQLHYANYNIKALASTPTNYYLHPPDSQPAAGRGSLSGRLCSFCSSESSLFLLEEPQMRVSITRSTLSMSRSISCSSLRTSCVLVGWLVG